MWSPGCQLDGQLQINITAVGKRQVQHRTGYCHHSTFGEFESKGFQPSLMRQQIIVKVGDDISVTCAGANVASATHPLYWREDILCAVLRRQCLRPGAAWGAIDNDD